MTATKISTMSLGNGVAARRRLRVGFSTRTAPGPRTLLGRSERLSPFVVFADPKIDIKKAVTEAEEACAADDNAEECATAWDTVEELSAAASDLVYKKELKKDPLEEYCEEDPDANECRTFDE